MARQLELWDDPDGDPSFPATPPPATNQKAIPPADAQAPPVLPRTQPSPEALEALAGELSRLSGMRVLIKVTTHRQSLLRVVHDPARGVAHLSLHWIFLDAPAAVLKAVAAWVRTPRKLPRNSLVRDYMNANVERIPPARIRSVTIRTKGEHYDLAALFSEINTAHFECSITAKITWGPVSPVGGGRKGHFRLGSYSEDRNLIRIHPVLDNPQIPEFVVRNVVFHEMLHAAVGIKTGESGRRSIHHAEFRRREKEYTHYAAAEAWIANPRNMRLLIKLRKNGIFGLLG